MFVHHVLISTLMKEIQPHRKPGWKRIETNWHMEKYNVTYWQSDHFKKCKNVYAFDKSNNIKTKNTETQ